MSDATQAVGKVPVNVQEEGIDLMAFSAHKLYGPKGVGALYVRRRNPRVRLTPQVHGGGHERGFRSGTLNVPGIVGFAAAISICIEEQPAESQRLRSLRDDLFARLQRQIEGLRLVGPELSGERLTHNLNVAIPDLDGETLMLQMPQIALSSGAACSASDPEPSHVLQALGMTEDQARCTLRIGLGRFTTPGEIDLTVEQIAGAAAALRG